MRFVTVVLAAILCGCSPAPTDAGETPLQPWPGVTVRPEDREVRIEARACLDAGWLEQIACSPDTREHESLVVIESRPSDVHAALLLAGFEPGSPGQWVVVSGEVTLRAPQGAPLDIFVSYRRDDRLIEESIRSWMIDAEGRATFPEDSHWVFGGSLFAPNPDWMGPGEHYVADQTGSIIGLVTFGDEVIGYQRVIADAEAVQPPLWQVNTGHVPPIGTAVTVILRPAAP